MRQGFANSLATLALIACAGAVATDEPPVAATVMVLGTLADASGEPLDSFTLTIFRTREDPEVVAFNGAAGSSKRRRTRVPTLLPSPRLGLRRGFGP